MKKISIIGLGLMGGSIAKAIRHHQLAEIISAFDNNGSSLEYAKKHRLIDHFAASILPVITDAELIILATPANALPTLFDFLANHLHAGQVVTDIASIKVNVIQAAKKLNQQISQFVPGHPIIGSEKSGIEHAIDDLFTKATVILTPTISTQTRALDIVKQFWQNLQAKVMVMPAEEHDHAMSLISHTPHIAANAYMHLIQNKELMSISGKGFRDFTRIAAGNPNLWRDICLANREPIIKDIDKFVEQLNRFKHAITENNAQKMLELFTHGHQLRKDL